MACGRAAVGAQDVAGTHRAVASGRRRGGDRRGWWRVSTGARARQVDATRVTGLVAAAREALRRGDAEVAIGLFGDVNEAFRGEPYEGVPDTALPAGEVQRLVELREAVVEDSAEAQLDRGQGERCIGELEAFVQANPYRERAWGLLMRALYQAGRPADALAAFGRARLLLAAELGIEPGPALRDVEQAILTHDPQLAPTAAASQPRLGRSNLPAAVSPIVGRQLELAVLAPLLLSERLVTLTGVGGIGKTRLAIDLVTQARHEWGPFFVDLAGINDVELVPAALAAVLGVQVQPNQDAMTVVGAVLAEHPVVILVDNCEHLLPGIAELIAGLAASSSGVRVVATSREALGVAGERVCPVDPLPVPSAEASVDQVKESDAGTLLLARLPMNLATGPLSPEELDAVGAICRTLEGIPLGLELAAARCRTMSLPQLADRLARSIGDLAPSRHGVHPRHRTMRAALDWGFALLSPPAQAALQAMSVFAGGCDLAAFAAVCHDDDAPPAIEVLDELVRTSFAVADHTGQRTRYRLLEPVRQFAAELLAAAGEEDARRQRHLRFFSDLARTLDERQTATGKAPLEALLRELGNLRAALDRAQDADETEAGLCLAADMESVWIGEAALGEPVRRALLGALGAATDRSLSHADVAAMQSFSEERASLAAGFDERVQLRAQVDGAMALRLLGRNADAEARLRPLWDRVRRHVLPQMTLEVGALFGTVLHSLGRLVEAEAVVDEFAQLGVRLVEFGPSRAYAVALPFRIAVSRGDWRGAVDGLRTAAATEPDPHYRLQAHIERAVALALVDPLGAVDEIGEAVSASLADAEASRCERCIAEATARGAESLARSGDVAGARALLDSRDLDSSDAYGALCVRRARAVLTIVDGLDSEAVDAVEAVIADAERQGLNLDALRARLDLGALLARTDRGRAVEVLRAAGAEAERFGARTEQQLAERSLRSLGVRTWRRAATGDGEHQLSALTDREREIAAMVSAGSTNPEIAAAVFLSRKTVERHVSNILAKLGMRNRAELAALSVEPAPTVPHPDRRSSWRARIEGVHR